MHEISIMKSRCLIKFAVVINTWKFLNKEKNKMILKGQILNVTEEM